MHGLCARKWLKFVNSFSAELWNIKTGYKKQFWNQVYNHCNTSSMKCALPKWDINMGNFDTILFKQYSRENQQIDKYSQYKNLNRRIRNYLITCLFSWNSCKTSKSCLSKYFPRLFPYGLENCHLYGFTAQKNKVFP